MLMWLIGAARGGYLFTTASERERAAVSERPRTSGGEVVEDNGHVGLT
ncbi:hypothetical protein AGR7A_pAt30153 [Agrobacterium deltaense NCPPB 1641]|uniref:Uncharacterized protein n=1 Tax=Agrobacterium deltaense NCPPB 1641 TaxID=1183425 RepID=A0A1S7UBD0_9HYPH|nr:hypothetical protein AGR7A_pAt30153 [Agrobacterium deltaense NCPPB 1641]